MSAQTVEASAAVNSDPYAHPDKFCDLVMKGGIASGVVYPLAVCELAKTYSFKSIGGASAGAIAAATAAAAEYGRRNGAKPDGSNGFRRLETVPSWLAQNLSTLFQPNPSTRPLFHVLTSAIGGKGGLLKKAVAIVSAGWSNLPGWALLGLIIGASLLLTLADFLQTPEATGAKIVLYTCVTILALVFVLIVPTVCVLVGLVLRAKSAIPQNFYGLTTGLLDPQGKDKHPPLTTWMGDELDGLAGKDRAHPLTFGDLWGMKGEPGEKVPEPKDRAINLEMMTTNLTHGRPYRLPFDDDSTRFFYDPAEWRRFFPEHIVAWMEQHPRQSNKKPGTKDYDDQQAEWASFRPLLPLPPPQHLPVVVAARMSLSFPVLISAVPLYTVDRSLVLERDAAGKVVGKPKLERCVFSDGGISSNFPIHFFDKPLPRWPTFGINFGSFHPDYPPDADQSKNSYLRQINSPLADVWDRFDQKESGFGQLGGFFGALVNTMYNWADNAQVGVPGYRERVIDILLTKTEGGLNLNMEPQVIKELTERGRWAGVKLREQFAGGDGSDPTWDSHRWIRFRSIMSMLETLVSDLRYGYQNSLPGDKTFDELVMRGKTDPPRSYRWQRNDQRDFAREMMTELLELVKKWDEHEQRFSDGEPGPAPELRVKPRI